MTGWLEKMGSPQSNAMSDAASRRAWKLWMSGFEKAQSPSKPSAVEGLEGARAEANKSKSTAAGGIQCKSLAL
jgi:hypothetical protein